MSDYLAPAAYPSRLYGRRDDVRERFLRTIEPEPNSGCWLWIGARSGGVNGYGSFGTNGFVGKAHRFAYEQFVGPIPDGMHVLHSCDNKPCVNPAHLRVGTVRDNMLDKYNRGRGRSRGQKLMPADVKLIRASIRASGRQALSQKYGITPKTVDAVVARRTWSHV